MITLNHRLYINLNYSTTQPKAHDPDNFGEVRVHVTRRESDLPNEFFLHIGNGIVISINHDDWKQINQEVTDTMCEKCDA